MDLKVACEFRFRNTFGQYAEGSKMFGRMCKLNRSKYQPQPDH